VGGGWETGIVKVTAGIVEGLFAVASAMGDVAFEMGE